MHAWKYLYIYGAHLIGTFQLEYWIFLLNASGVTEINSFRNSFEEVNSYLWKY